MENQKMNWNTSKTTPIQEWVIPNETPTLPTEEQSTNSFTSWNKKYPENELPNWGYVESSPEVPTWDSQNNTLETPEFSWGQPEISQNSIPPSTTRDQHNDTSQIPSSDWGNSISTPELITDKQSTPTPLPQEDFVNLTHLPLGIITKLRIGSEVYKLESNLDSIESDLQSSNLTPLNSENLKYDFSPTPNTNLGNIIHSIINIGKSKGLKISDCFIGRSEGNNNINNIFGKKSKANFIYFIKGSALDGSVYADLSLLEGPSPELLSSTTDILSILPGWLPCNFINKGVEEVIFIAGSFN